MQMLIIMMSTTIPKKNDITIVFILLHKITAFYFTLRNKDKINLSGIETRQQIKHNEFNSAMRSAICSMFCYASNPFSFHQLLLSLFSSLYPI